MIRLRVEWQRVDRHHRGATVGNTLRAAVAIVVAGRIGVIVEAGAHTTRGADAGVGASMMIAGTKHHEPAGGGGKELDTHL